MMAVVFIHRGWPKYLELAVNCARRHFDGEIILISDQPKVSNLPPNTRLIPIEEVSFGLEAVPSRFRIDSVKSVEFESACFQRFVILSNLMSIERMKSAIYLDSDLLITSDILEIFDKELSKGSPMLINSYSTYFSGWTPQFLRSFVEGIELFLEESLVLGVHNNDMECLNYHLHRNWTGKPAIKLKENLAAYRNNETETSSFVYYLMKHYNVWDWNEIRSIPVQIDDVVEWRDRAPFVSNAQLDFIHLHGFTKGFVDYFSTRLGFELSSAQNNTWW